MTAALPDSLLAEFSRSLAEQVGICVPQSRWNHLARGIHAVADQKGLQDAHLIHQHLAGQALAAEQIDTLVTHLTVGETYFFREPRALEILESRILPDLISARRGRDQRLRFWSAGCCTGEEPYTLAILLTRLLPDLPDWDVTILATDINRDFLASATGGEYPPWSFRNTPEEHRERCFTPTSRGRFQILPHLREMVSFSYLNLARDPYPSLLNNTNAMDVVFCRNVLMYFAPQVAAGVVRHLSHSLVDGGWLIVSPTETPIVDEPDCPRVSFPGVTLYQKRSDPTPGPAIQPASIPLLRPAGPAVTAPAQRPVTWRAPSPPPRPPGRPLPVPVHAAPPAPAPVLDAPPAPPASVEPTPYHEAVALYESGQYREAAARLAALIESQTADDEGKEGQRRAMLLLARSRANQGLLADALAWCERAGSCDSLDPEVRNLRSSVLQEQGRLDEAAADLRRTLYLDPGFILAHFALGNLGLRQGHPGAGRRHFQNALALLAGCVVDEPLAQADGITAGRLREIITSIADLGDGDA